MTATYEQISEAIREEIREARELTIADHTERREPLTESCHRSTVRAYENLTSDYTEALARADYSLVHGQVERIFRGLGLGTGDGDGYLFRRACRELTEGMLEALEVSNRLLAGEVIRDEPTVSAVVPAAASEVAPAPVISEMIEQFIAGRVSGQRINSSTAKQYRTAADQLIHVVGDLPVNQIDFMKACEARDRMLKMPKGNLGEYRGKTCEEKLDLDIPEEDFVRAQTVSQRLVSLGTFFSWLVDTELVSKNPFQRVTCKSDKENYEAYSVEELTALFSSPLYTGLSNVTRSHWWLPLILLHTGMRPGELVQVRPSDVKEIDGVMVIDLPREFTLKNKRAVRAIPLHPTLLDLGFLEFTEEATRRGQDRLMAGFTGGKTPPAHKASMWFNRSYLKTHLPEFYANHRKRLYSFRHTFQTFALSENSLPLERVQLVVGHERTQMGSTDSYDAGLRVGKLFSEVVSKVEFGELDLGHLKGGWRHFDKL
ncbi:hypothetical protein GCM10025791_27000 [Halioxenophilus aromaticivorans]|uniref:Tyr recombinase domain-containing protein n=2 Tax=Halioxenophilus aromaticivorans TaxID=1306992 RepID=A0AAV3U462_9ALTE